MVTNKLSDYVQDYGPGTVLFREGEPGDDMYVIQAGEVEIRRRIGDSDRTIAVLPAGEFFGEMALLNNNPRSATAIVRGSAQLLRIGTATFETMLRENTEIAVRMMKMVTRRLERANQQIELLLLPNATHRVVQCLRQLAEQQSASPGQAVHLSVSTLDLAHRVGSPGPEVAEVLRRLAKVGLVMRADEAGIPGSGLLLPEVGRLLDFLEFLELKQRFG